MMNWRAKAESGTYGKSTLKTLKSPIEVDSRVTAGFLELVQITAACEHQLLLEHEVILAELTAADLCELQRTDRAERQGWAQLLAYRLCMDRLSGMPPQPADAEGGRQAGAAGIDYRDLLARLVGKKREMAKEKVAATNSGNGGINPGQEDLDCTQPLASPNSTQRSTDEDFSNR